MTEQEYCDVTDLQLLRSVLMTLRIVNAFEDPNKNWLQSMKNYANFMIHNLEEKIHTEERNSNLN